MGPRFVIVSKRSATPSWDLASKFLTLVTLSLLSWPVCATKFKKIKIYSKCPRFNSKSI